VAVLLRSFFFESPPIGVFCVSAFYLSAGKSMLCKNAGDPYSKVS